MSVQAVILVGGEGTRMRPLTDTRPKPMLMVVDRPMVEHQLDHLRRHGITDVVFSCGYKPEAIQEYFGDGASLGMKLSYVVDPEPLGTAGALKNAEPLIHADAIVVRNGDILTDLDIGALAAAHRQAGALGTLTLTPVEDPSAFGLVRLHDDGRVEAFVEKPEPQDLRPGEPFRINAGTYYLSREVLGAIPAGRSVSIERETFPALAEAGRLFGFASGSYWRDIGNPGSYAEANHDVLSGAIVTDAPRGGRYLAPGAVVEPGAQVGDHSTVGVGARVAAGAKVERSVLGAGTVVGAGARVSDAILGADVRVGENAVVEGAVVVGDGAVIPPGAHVTGPTSLPTGYGSGSGEAHPEV
jgi:mannose-1-phosphate guanylyltransferase